MQRQREVSMSGPKHDRSIQQSSTSRSSRPSLLVRNLGEPIRLTGWNCSGVCLEAAKEGDLVKAATRLSLTSDQRNFHQVADNLTSIIVDHARKAGHLVNLNQSQTVLLVIRPDNSAELWLDTAAMELNVMVKHSMASGSAVFTSDIADVTGMRFPLVEIGPNDRLVCIFRQDWLFGLFFDFNPNNQLDLEACTKQLGTLYRKIKYKHLYEIISDKKALLQLCEAGWFPFVEILGKEFYDLAECYERGTDIPAKEENIVNKFDSERLERMFARWMTKPHFEKRKNLLNSALAAFKDRNPIPVIKILLTEVEGIIQDAYHVDHGKRPKLENLIRDVCKSAEKKAGEPDTLLLPSDFILYLKNCTFKSFDGRKWQGTARSRHAVGHGAANPDTYTMIAALQTILTLDQLAFYT